LLELAWTLSVLALWFDWLAKIDPREVKKMRGKRAIAGTSVVVSFIVLAAIGQQEPSSSQANAKTQLENCQIAMPIILKNYNNAKYAVQRARNSADASHILPAVNEAQLALDAMEQPLKVCNEAVHNERGEQPQNNKN
jgi:hypothetical protein